MKYLPYILAGVLFFAGRFTAPQPDKELLRKYEVERNYHLQQIDKLNAQADDLAKAGLMIAEKMKEDSLKYSIALKANNEAYRKLKKEYESINYSRASAAELDSVRARLLTLYSNRGK
jgi:hypothetical protein